MTTPTIKQLSVFTLSSVLLLIFAGHAEADVDGDIGVLGISPDHLVKFRPSPKPEDMNQIPYGSAGVILLNELAEKPAEESKVDEDQGDTEGAGDDEETPGEAPTDEQVEKVSDDDDILRIQFELTGPADAPFLLIAVPSDVEIRGIQSLRSILAMTMGRFDAQGKAEFGFTVPGTPEQLAGIKFITLRAATPADRESTDDDGSTTNAPAAPSMPGPQNGAEGQH